MLQRPKSHLVVATLQGTVVQRERGPFAVARQTRAVTFGEEPLETAQGTGQWLTFDEEQRLVGEGRRVVNGELAGASNQRGKYFDVTRESVRDVKA